MTNPNKAKGSSAERAVVDLLRQSGWPHAERRLAGAAKDRGDIAGVPGVVIEVKNCTRQDLAGWLAEAEQERVNDRADLAVVWHKRRGRANAADWFVTMDGATLVRLLAAAGYGSGVPVTDTRPILTVDDPGPRQLPTPAQAAARTNLFCEPCAMGYSCPTHDPRPPTDDPAPVAVPYQDPRGLREVPAVVDVLGAA